MLLLQCFNFSESGKSTLKIGRIAFEAVFKFDTLLIFMQFI